ncbi:MAG: beta-lactamase family protein, partial [Clostridia bacterium]|nr:beta-lactamase family protein [Clostridia bacterium]
MFDFTPVARYMEDVVCGKHNVPGCDIIIMREHETLYRHICGYSDRENKIPLDDSFLYYMYSCTKPVTVTAGMRLVEEGKLELDAPVSQYLPAFADVFLEVDGKHVPPKHLPTIRHLFTMSAGFDYAGGGEAQKKVIAESGGKASTQEIVNTYATRPLHFEPGAQFMYSNCHDILAAVIEVVSGMKFSDYLKKIMFTPLGMTDSTFDETPDVHARIAAQYTCPGNGIVERMATENSFRCTENYESGGAGLITSTEDYAKFADTMACEGTAKDGYRLLKPETVALLHSEQLHTFVMNNNFSCAAGPGYGYGLGVRTRINQDEGQRSPIGE